MKKLYIKFLYLLSIIVLSINLTGCKKTEAKPILNVVVDASFGGVGVLPNYKYYIVYDNGDSKKTEAFSRMDTENYAFNPNAEKNLEPHLHDIDMSIEKNRSLNDVAKSISDVISDDKDIFVGGAGTLYIVDDKYYFTVYLEKGANDVSVGLFEYNLSNNSISKVAVFDHDISHIQSFNE